MRKNVSTRILQKQVTKSAKAKKQGPQKFGKLANIKTDQKLQVIFFIFTYRGYRAIDPLLQPKILLKKEGGGGGGGLIATKNSKAIFGENRHFLAEN